MALKFLNKKGWHTGSLRNIENVWKAEQKHDAEQKKLEELRKQIQEERERSEFRQLQEQAGLVPRQERLDFLYESGLAVGKGSSEGFKALESPAPAAPASSVAGPSKAAAPGALFEDKPQSANDTWRKLHSDPLLLIRQREQESLARIKNNPIQMAMIRKSVESEKKHKPDDKGKREKKKHKRKHHHRTETSDSENSSGDRKMRDRLTSDRQKHSKRKHASHDSGEDEARRRKSSNLESEHYKHSERKHEKSSSKARPESKYSSESEEDRRKNGPSRHESKLPEREEERQKHTHLTSDNHYQHHTKSKEADTRQHGGYNRRKVVPKMTEEEREAKLREMQLDAELHEEQRFKRIKRAAEADAREVVQARSSGGKNFLDAAQKSIYGTEKGGSTTIEESVRRRAYYSQGGRAAHESNAFRR